VTRGERRDFLLDTGAVSALAEDDKLFVGYQRILKLGGGSLHIPSPVQSENHTGNPKHDTLVDRMVNRIGRAGVQVYIPGDPEIDKRAGELRYIAQKALDDANRGKPRKPRDEITGVDGQIMAIAERRSGLYAVTLVTTDLKHMNALINAAGARNIEVKLPR
jgi:hypothetical protein